MGGIVSTGLEFQIQAKQRWSPGSRFSISNYAGTRILSGHRAGVYGKYIHCMATV